MTVCIAAICNNGHNLICATDGMLSDDMSSVSGDVGASKMLFLDNWAFMLAGTLSNGDLILEELRLMAVESKGKAKISRESIRRLLAKAYRTQFSNWLAERWLSQYDMDMKEFKTKGKEYFGEQRFSEISRSVEQDSVNFNESILVAGWGATPHSASILGIDRGGFASHTLNGFSAIGSGGMVAMSTLMQLWYGRHIPTEDALYAVASAKFASESCMGVGEKTTICLLHKPKNKNDSPVGLLQPPHIEQLRGLWKRYGKPRIPESEVLTRIAGDIGSPTGMSTVRQFQRAIRTAKRSMRASSPNAPEPPPSQSGGAVPESGS